MEDVSFSGRQLSLKMPSGRFVRLGKSDDGELYGFDIGIEGDAIRFALSREAMGALRLLMQKIEEPSVTRWEVTLKAPEPSSK